MSKHARHDSDRGVRPVPLATVLTWPLLSWLDWLNAWTKFWLGLKFRHGNFTYSDFPLNRVTKL